MKQQDKCLRILSSLLDDWKAEISQLEAKTPTMDSKSQYLINKRIATLSAELQDAELVYSELTEPGRVARRTKRNRSEPAWWSWPAQISETT